MAILISTGTLFLAWRKASHESRNIEADTEGKISEAALALVEPLKKRVDELEAARERDKARIVEHERRITELECELREERSQKLDLLDGAHKLVHQVESLGGMPVYKPPEKK